MKTEITLTEQDISEILKGYFVSFGEPQVQFSIDDGENGEKVVSVILRTYGDLMRAPATMRENLEENRA